MTRAFVTGGSGLLGGDLIRHLVRRGDEVVGLARSVEAAEAVRTVGATVVEGDVFDERVLTDGMWGSDVVYHVAGVNDTCPRDVATMDRVNVEGTRAVVRAAAAAGVRRLVFTSSAATIGEAEGMIGSEGTQHNGEYLSPYARSKTLAEAAAFATAERLDVDLVSVNPSSVQGPGRAGGSAEMLLRVLRSRRPLLVETHVSIVDIADCSAGHIAAAERGRAGERYILSGATFRVSEAVTMASEMLGRPIEPRFLPAGLVRGIGPLAARVLQLVSPDAGVCPALVRTLLHGHRFDGSRAERELGVTYTPFDTTMRRTIDWFTSEGLIAAG